MLWRTFATHGCPHVIMSDNARSFTREEFSKFYTLNGIKHVRSTPCNPSSNGLAEQWFKNGSRWSRNTTTACLGSLPSISTTTTNWSVTNHVVNGWIAQVSAWPGVSGLSVEWTILKCWRIGIDKEIDSIWEMLLTFQGKPKWMSGVLEESNLLH